MLKRSMWFSSAALAAMLGGGMTAFAQEAAPDAEALFQKLDKNGDGKLSKDEVPEEQTRFFERLVRLGDADKDGSLTKDEFKQANKPEEKAAPPVGGPGNGGSGQRGGDPRQRFEMMDKNKDGKLTLDEFPEQFRDRIKPVFERLGKTELTADEFAKLPNPGGMGGPGGQRPDPKESFKQFDKNNDGKLTKDELPELLRNRIGQVFERLGKTELTEEEWVKAAGRFMGQAGGSGGQRPEPGAMFKQFDANGDGKLTKDEMPAEMRERLAPLFERLGKTEITQDEFARGVERLRGAGEGRPGQNPEGQRPEGERRPEGDRGSESRRPEGDRRPEGERASEDRRPEGDRGPEVRRPEERRPDGDRNPETRRPDGERRPEGDRGPEGRRPEGDRGPDARRPEARRGLRDDLTARPGDRGPDARRPEARGPEGRGPEGDRRPDGPRGPMIIRKLDKNHDGRLSKDELAELVDLFDELDTNHDGQLDPFELIGGPMGPPRDGDRPQGSRRPDGDRGPEGRRPEGDRGSDARRPEGERRDSARPERPRSESDDRRPERDREQPRERDDRPRN